MQHGRLSGNKLGFHFAMRMLNASAPCVELERLDAESGHVLPARKAPALSVVYLQ